jgi:protein SCO1/2
MIVAVTLLAGIAFLADYLLQLRQNKGVVPPGAESQIGGAFSLVDQTGRAVTEKDFSNRHQLIFFGFTHCPDVCPTTLGRVSAILQRLGPLADRLYPLFITVDPRRDTPERLREYAAAFDPRIIYLTGTDAEIEHVMEAWRATRAKCAVGEHDYSMTHSAVLYLMSPAGKLIKSYGWDQDPEAIEASIRKYLTP